jgi:hypothetical protein
MAFNPNLREQCIILTARDLVKTDQLLLDTLGLYDIPVLSRKGLTEQEKAMHDKDLKVMLLKRANLQIADGCQFFDDMVENCVAIRDNFNNIDSVLVGEMGNTYSRKF